MRYPLYLMALLFASVALAQVNIGITNGFAPPQLFGIGAAGNNYICTATTAGVLYIQTDATNGRLWVCDNSSGSYAWDHQISPTLNTAVTGTITGGAFLAGGCTATTTVAISGATVGVNSAIATPIYASAPTGNQGLFNLTAWVSAANTVTVQGCALGVLSSVPNFIAKVLLY